MPLTNTRVEPKYVSPHTLPPIEHPALLAFVTDCQDDLAVTKVEIAKLSAFGKNWSYPDTLGNPSYATHVLGVQTVVLAGILADYSEQHEVPVFIIANSAPRKNGEGLVGGEILVAVLDNGVPILITNGEGALDPFVGHIDQLWKLETDDMDWLPPTQFRSFKWFSQLAQKFLYDDRDLVKTYIEDIGSYVIPHRGDFCWIGDSFGNVKLTLTEDQLAARGIEDGDEITLRIGNREIVVEKRDKLFPLPAGADRFHIGFYRGSDVDLNGRHYYELAIAHESASAWIENYAKLVDKDGNELVVPNDERAKFVGGESVEIVGIVKTIDRDRPVNLRANHPVAQIQTAPSHGVPGPQHR